MFNIRREQGRLAEVEGAVRGFIELYPAIPAWRGALALLLVELGRPDEARAEFERGRRGRLRRLREVAAFPRDANWLIAITLMAEVCGALGDAARAAELYRLLAPYAGRNVVVGRNATCNGSASRLLGVLAAAQGEWDVAEGHFDEAQRCTPRWAPAPGTRARRCRTRRCCCRAPRAGRRGAGDGDARRRDPGRGRAGDGRAGRAGAAARAGGRFGCNGEQSAAAASSAPVAGGLSLRGGRA